MDGMVMGTPWLDKPLSQTYRAFECQFNDTALCEYESGYWRFWYVVQDDRAFQIVRLTLL